MRDSKCTPPTQVKGGAPGVDFCVIYTHFNRRKATFMWDSKCTPPTRISGSGCESMGEVITGCTNGVNINIKKGDFRTPKKVLNGYVVD